jgi:hypothetical protein
VRWSPRGPFWQDFQPSHNPIAWEDCFVMRASGDGFAMDFLGEGLLWQFFDGRAPDPGEVCRRIGSLFGDLRLVIDAGVPLKREGIFERRDDRLVYRSLLLPFVDLQQRPIYVLGAVTYAWHDGATPV